MRRVLERGIVLVSSLLLVSTVGLAQDDPATHDDTTTEEVSAPPDDEVVDPIDASIFEHRPAVLQFIDVNRKTFISGYVTGVFSDFGKDHPADEVPPGQLLVSATDKSSFGYDWAIFLGANPSENLRVLVETHFVSDPGGDFEPVIVTTEANVAWMPFGPNPLRIAMGEYWVPFGLVNDDWYSAANLFALIPEAAKAFPLHYNERGMKLTGEFAMGEETGVNYAFSVGNGVRGLGINDQHSKDFDNNKAVVGRVGFFPGIRNLEIGLSASNGTLREEGDLEAPIDDHHRYPGDMQAVGLDVVYRTPTFKLRGYWISSQESLDGAADLDREGAVLEGVFTLYEGDGLIKAVEPKLRVDWLRRDVLLNEEIEKTVVGVGLDLWIYATGVIRFDYFFRNEVEGISRDDDGFAFRMTAAF